MVKVEGEPFVAYRGTSGTLIIGAGYFRSSSKGTLPGIPSAPE